MATRHEGDVELEPLTPIDLDDAELGIRPEDRYAAIPPGPKLIRRRVHDESSWAPLWLLVGLVALFVVGALLGRGDGASEPGPAPSTGAPPPLPTVTGEQLLLVGAGGVAEYDVDDGTVAPLRAEGFAGPVFTAARTDTGAVVLDDENRAYTLADGAPAVDLGPVAGIAGGAGRAWLLVADGAGGLVAREASASGAPPREVPLPLPGRVNIAASATEYGIVAAVSEGPPQETSDVEIWLVPFDAPSEPQRLRRAVRLLGASATSLAMQPHRCTDARCDLVLVDLETSDERVLPDALPSNVGPTELSRDGEWLFLQAGSRIEAVDTETGRRYAVGELPREYPALAA